MTQTKINFEYKDKAMPYDALLANVFIHKNTGEKLRIRKLFGSVALCVSEIKREVFKKPRMTTNTVVCSISNLTQVKQCNYCETTIEIKDGIFICKDCSL